MTSKVWGSKTKNRRVWDCQTQKLLLSRNTINRAQRWPVKWENIFANHVSDQGLVSRIYEELLQLNTQPPPPNNPIKKWSKGLNVICKWPTNTWKDAQHLSLSEECKSKSQHFTWHLLGKFYKKKRKKQVMRIQRKLKPLRTAGGAVPRPHQYGKQYEGPSESKTTTRPCNPASRHTSRGTKSRVWRRMCPPTFTVSISTVAKEKRRPKCPLTHEWTKCGRCVNQNTIQSLKRKETLSHATTWMILEDMC